MQAEDTMWFGLIKDSTAQMTIYAVFEHSLKLQKMPSKIQVHRASLTGRFLSDVKNFSR